VRLLSPAFMLLLGLTVAMSIQVVGALLVLSVVCTPAAAAMRVTASPVLVPVLSVLFAVTATVGGTLLELGSYSVPISPYVTTISFMIYAVCRVIGALRSRRGWTTRAVAATA
jgi:zinc/manganese transport system permease protein